MTAAVQQSLLLAGRSLRHIPRIPEKLLDVTIMPVVFVVTFAYVFGSQIHVDGGSYHEYLIAGMFANGAFQPLQGLAVGVAEDVRRGIVDRLLALPISRAAFLVGRNLADNAERLLGSVIFVPLGLLVGWRVHTDAWHVLAAFALVNVLAFAISWVGTWIGLIAREGETAQQISFLVFFPLMFTSGIFVPVQPLPDVLRFIAQWNPISAAATAMRQLFGNPVGQLPDVWPLQHPVLATLAWSALLTAIFAPLAINRYKKVSF
jgi:ABC-2 type transport system permease protein